MVKRFLLVVAAVPFFAAAATSAVGEDDAAYSRKGADTCLSCHDDGVTLAVFKTGHAVPTDPDSPFGHGQLQCESCHGPGDAHAGRVRRGQERPAIPAFGETSAATAEVQNGYCLNCHEGDVGFGWHIGAHAGDEVSCADCHDSHNKRDAVLQVATQAEVCNDCHRIQANQTAKAFSHPIIEGKMACSDCHGIHSDSSGTQFARQTLNETCVDCHAEKRGPYLWEHAPVSEDCGLCHAPHGSNHSGMLTKRAPLLCQGCHAQSGHPSISYGTDGLAANQPSQHLLGQGCMNCHSQVHGSNHPSGSLLMR